MKKVVEIDGKRRRRRRGGATGSADEDEEVRRFHGRQRSGWRWRQRPTRSSMASETMVVEEASGGARRHSEVFGEGGLWWR